MATGTSNKASGAKRRYKLWLMFIVMFLCWAAYTLYGQMTEGMATGEKLASIEAQMEEAQQETERLKHEIEKLNDPEYIAQLATKEQGMVKQGERQIFSE
jgi:Septum formation initiator